MNRKLYLNSMMIEDDAKVFDQVEYSDGKNVYVQEELTVEQMEAALKLLKDDVAKETNNAKQFDFINLKVGHEKLLALLSIAFGATVKDLKRLKYSQLKVMVNDFFFLNSELSKELAALSQIATLEMMTRILQNSENTLNQFRPTSDQPQKTSSSSSQDPKQQSLKKRKK